MAIRFYCIFFYFSSIQWFCFVFRRRHRSSTFSSTYFPIWKCVPIKQWLNPCRSLCIDVNCLVCLCPLSSLCFLHFIFWYFFLFLLLWFDFSYVLFVFVGQILSSTAFQYRLMSIRLFLRMRVCSTTNGLLWAVYDVEFFRFCRTQFDIESNGMYLSMEQLISLRSLTVIFSVRVVWWQCCRRRNEINRCVVDMSNAFSSSQNPCCLMACKIPKEEKREIRMENCR